MNSTNFGYQPIDVAASEINEMANDVNRMAEIGDRLRKVFARLFWNKTYMRKWIEKRCDFSIPTAIRYMLLSCHMNKLRKANIKTLSEAYRELDIDANVQPNLASPWWDRIIHKGEV